MAWGITGGWCWTVGSSWVGSGWVGSSSSWIGNSILIGILPFCTAAAAAAVTTTVVVIVSSTSALSSCHNMLEPYTRLHWYCSYCWRIYGDGDGEGFPSLAERYCHCIR
jgi:hypothetical protein